MYVETIPMIFSIQHIRQIIQKEKELLTSFTMEEYIRECFKVVNKHLISYFNRKSSGNKKNYLLHKAYFLNEDGLSSLTFSDIEEYQHGTSKIKLESAEQVILLRGKKPFGRLLIECHLQALVLYNGQRPPVIEGVIAQNLNSPGAVQRIAKELNVKSQEIQELFNEHKSHGEYFRDGFYEYFIRPFAEHQSYNGVLLVILRKSLSEEELLELGNFWTKLLSETKIATIESISRAAEQQYIFEEHTHTWNTEISSIIRHLDIVSRRIDTLKDSSARLLSDDINYALFKTNLLRTINTFNLLLMKTRGFRSLDEVLKHCENEKIDTSFINIVQPESVSIKPLLLDAINTLEIVTSSFSNNGTLTKLRIDALKKVKEDVSRLADISIRTARIGFYIIALDLIKNATVHSSKSKPVIGIQILETKREIKIQFSNNSPLSEEAYHYINNNKSTSNISFRRKGGVRTIKRILSSPFLSENGKRWKLVAEKSSLKSVTIIALIIPKT